MSLSHDSRHLHCDGGSCDATAPYPVTSAQGRDSRGWLFVQHHDRVLHFCPRCLADEKHLPHLERPLL